LLIEALDLIRNRKKIVDLVSKSLTEILKRYLTLERIDKIAISQEFKEWINGMTKEDDIWVVNY
tara:strand:+ start:72 stop:263 length:192 start_codon:yes stop_codon:yes gene_type:complete